MWGALVQHGYVTAAFFDRRSLLHFDVHFLDAPRHPVPS